MADNQEEPGKMFVGGLSWETTEDKLRTYFSQFGEVSKSTVMIDRETGKPRGFGFVTFANPKDTENVLALQEHTLDGKKIDPKLATKDQGKNKVFLGGVPGNATKEIIEEVFQKFGAVKDVDCKIEEGTNKCRGFAFLTFESEKSASAAIEEHYVTIQEKQVEVKKADPSNRKNSARSHGQLAAHAHNGFSHNGHQFRDPQTQQTARGAPYYSQYATHQQPYYQQQYYPSHYNGSSGAGYSMPPGGANGQGYDYSGYQNSRDGGYLAQQQQYAGYPGQQGHYGANQAQGYGRSQHYNGYPVHQ